MADEHLVCHLFLIVVCCSCNITFVCEIPNSIEAKGHFDYDSDGRVLEVERLAQY
jgi:hypothetical protein